MKYSEAYLSRVQETTPAAVSSIQSTIEVFRDRHLKNFTFMERKVGLLLGQVQSGKTGQMFGVMSAAADVGFELFVVLTSGMTALQRQTLERARTTIDSFNVCGEHDEVQFHAGKLRKPTVVILKKNSKVLKKWKNELVRSGYCVGRPVFIIDDEADATSLNTRTNRKEENERSTINQLVLDISRLGSSSFYLQVTATPQALLLQSLDSKFKPEIIHYFPPGANYLGGTFFYPDQKPFSFISTADDELSQLTEANVLPDGMKRATASFLVTLAHQVSNNIGVCNFLVHPSSRINDHSVIEGKFKDYFDYMLSNVRGHQQRILLQDAHDDLRRSKPHLLSFEKVLRVLENCPKVNFITMNSGPDGETAPNTDEGYNVIIGGNSLGRGVTFKALQTVYYLRSARRPQADTFWQHARMFGYDRDPALMRVFMPVALYNLFSELNNSNQVIYEQVEAGEFRDLQIILPPGIKPTRDAVINVSKLRALVGGVNYFPPNPNQSNVRDLDPLLSDFDSTSKYEIRTTAQVERILEYFEDDRVNEWTIKSYIAALRSLYTQSNYVDEVAITVRRNRSISHGTGTMLSPDDRRIGTTIRDLPWITLYRNAGDVSKGWEGSPFWMVNIRLPFGRVFFVSTEEAGQL